MLPLGSKRLGRAFRVRGAAQKAQPCVPRRGAKLWRHQEVAFSTLQHGAGEKAEPEKGAGEKAGAAPKGEPTNGELTNGEVG